MPPSPVEDVIRPRLPVDLDRTLAPLLHGEGDPSVRRERRGVWWRATRTPSGPATIRLEAAPSSGEVRVRAWGPGAAWALRSAPDLVGARDRVDGFEPRGVLREVHRRLSGLRVIRSRAVVEALVPAILAQRVTGREAASGYRGLVAAWGEPAPGPARLTLPPSAEGLASVPSFAYHPLGIERRRAETIRRAARVAARLEEALAMEPEAARARLRAVPGVGAWTAARVALVALGDADAVLVGDFHLPNAVSWLLAGEPRGDDARMLELLEPYRGHRGRVLRLISASGLRAPRFGPRLAPRSIARI